MQEDNKLKEVRMQENKNGKGMKRKQECDKPIRESTNDKSQEELTNDELQNAERLGSSEPQTHRKEIIG